MLYCLQFSTSVQIIPRLIYIWDSQFFLELIILISDGVLFKLTQKQLCSSTNCFIHLCGVESN